MAPGRFALAEPSGAVPPPPPPRWYAPASGEDAAKCVKLLFVKIGGPPYSGPRSEFQKICERKEWAENVLTETFEQCFDQAVAIPVLGGGRLDGGLAARVCARDGVKEAIQDQRYRTCVNQPFVDDPVTAWDLCLSKAFRKQDVVACLASAKMEKQQLGDTICECQSDPEIDWSTEPKPVLSAKPPASAVECYSALAGLMIAGIPSGPLGIPSQQFKIWCQSEDVRKVAKDPEFRRCLTEVKANQIPNGAIALCTSLNFRRKGFVACLNRQFSENGRHVGDSVCPCEQNPTGGGNTGGAPPKRSKH
jgi:hypothetical protein